MKSMSRNLFLFSRAGFILCFLFLAVSANAQRPLGTDVSDYQTNINWTVVKNAGVVFTWVQATEGTGYVDGGYAAEASGAKAVGIYVGMYHYALPSDDPNITGSDSADSEAAHFWNVASNYVKVGGGCLVPMLDWEDSDVTGLTAAQLSEWVNEWCNDVSNYAAAEGLTIRPVVYTGAWYSDPANGYPGLNSTVTNWPNWMAAYPDDAVAQTGNPGDTYPWPSWDIWQYYDTNWSGGDSDVYNGTLANFLKTFAIGGVNAPFFVSAPTNVTAAVNSNATFYAQASGQTLSFQWYFDGKLIPDATSSNYTIADVQLTNAGYYTVTASNSYADIPNTASLSVLGPLTNAPDSALDPSNMVNWWTADGNPFDIYGVTNGTPYGDMSYTNGKVGQAFRFDGSSAYLLTSGTEMAPPWTVCAWVFRQNAPGTAAALMGDSTYVIKLEQYGHTSDVGITESGVADYYFTTGLTANTWSHLALVNNGSTVELYINGEPVTSQLYSNSVAVSPPSGFPLPRACIGADLLANGNPTDYSLGAVDELQTFNRALSAAQIASIYDAGSDGLVCAPQFTALTNLNNGEVQINLIGQTGKAITIKASTNLLSGWTTLGSLSNPTGSTNFMDSTASPQEFYQATQKY